MLDKKYKAICLDLILNTQNNLNMTFSLSDNQTSDFYININKNSLKIDLTGYKTTLYIKNPNNEILSKELTEYDKTNNLYYCNLENKYKNIEGTYVCQIIIEDSETTEKIVPLSVFEYEVKKDIISEQNGSQIPSGDVGVEYNPDTETIVFTGNINYDETTESIKEVV